MEHESNEPSHSDSSHVDLEEAIHRVSGILDPTVSSRAGEQLVLEGELRRSPDEAYAEQQRRFMNIDFVTLSRAAKQ